MENNTSNPATVALPHELSERRIRRSHHEDRDNQISMSDTSDRLSTYDSLLMFPLDDSMTGKPLKNGGYGEHPRQKPRRLKIWGWELAACFLSLVSLSAIIAILSIENGKPLDQWTWTIGPTAVVSFITTIARSSMLLAVTEAIGELKWRHFRSQPRPMTDLQIFDNAGRGPLGATQLLWNNHVNTPIASLAAVIVVVALLVDPFMQLVFSFPTLSQLEQGGIAAFNKTEVFEGNGNFWDPTRHPVSTIYSETQSAIIQAISGESVLPDAICSTGNCTWQDTTTLGICGDCTNVTSQVKQSCGWIPGENQYKCDYTMPTGRNLSGYAFHNGGAGTSLPTIWNSSAIWFDADALEPGSLATLVYFEAIQLKEKSDDILGTLQSMTGWGCSLSLCAKTYANLSMTNGVVATTEAIEEYMQVTNNVQPDTYHDYLSKGLRTNSTSESTSPYQINRNEYSNTAEYLQEMFSMSWISGGNELDSDLDSAVPNLGFQLAVVEDLGEIVQNIAKSMTEVIRNSRNSTRAPGQAFRTKTYIRVQWGWIALPLSLTVLSICIIIFIVVKAGMDDSPVWKNSSLALLLYDVPGWKPDSALIKESSDLEKDAKNISITLSDSGDLSFTRK